MAKCQVCGVEYVKWTSRVPNTCTLCAQKLPPAQTATLPVAPPQGIAASDPASGREAALPVSRAVTRYRDGYIVARATNGIGAAVKILSVIIGAVIALIALVIGSNTHPAFVLVGLVLAVIVGVPLFVLGVLLSAHGQVLKAALDSAVHTSPFLTDEEKAHAMNL